MTAPDRAKLRAVCASVLDLYSDPDQSERDYNFYMTPKTILALLDMLDAKDAQEKARDALDFLPPEHESATTPQPAPLSAFYGVKDIVAAPEMEGCIGCLFFHADCSQQREDLMDAGLPNCFAGHIYIAKAPEVAP